MELKQNNSVVMLLHKNIFRQVQGEAIMFLVLLVKSNQ